MKILVTGPRGFVGSRIMADMGDVIPAPTLRDMDRDGIRRLIDQIGPDLVIHTAAMSDVGQCEKHPEEARHANVHIPLWIASAGVKAVIFSSDQVYLGSAGEGPYTEEDARPANLYGELKMIMEKSCLDANPSMVLLRATWMYDMPMYGGANRGNFLVNMLREKQQAFSSTQLRGITFVREVTGRMKDAMLLPGGVYNFGSEADRPMLDTARWLKDTLDLDVSLADAGPRHHLWMNCEKSRQHGVCFSDNIGGLRECIRAYGLSKSK